MIRLSKDFRARQQTYVRPRVVYRSAPDWSQAIAMLIVFGTIATAIVANEMINIMGWMR